MKVTQAKIEANRRNAQMSTEPKTPNGHPERRQRVSTNWPRLNGVHPSEIR